MVSWIRIIILLSLFSSVSSFAEITTVKFYAPDYPDIGTRYIGIPISLSSDSSSAKFSCYDNDLLIKAQKHETAISYRLYDRQDKVLDVIFPIDSLKKWTNDDGYDKRSVKFVFRNIEMFFIPGTKIDYNVKAYNKFPFMLSVADFKTNSGSFPNTTLYLDDGDSIKTPAIIVCENGKLHRKEIYSGHVFKEKYFDGDSVTICGSRYVIDKIDLTSASVKFVCIEDVAVVSYIDRGVYQSLAPYFSDRDYLLVDFWGTWCAPCIKGLPTLKKLYEEYCDRVSFLSVCFDDLSNRDVSVGILNENKVTWNSIFEEFNDMESITQVMGITHFPTFVLINKKGQIEAFLIGEQGLNSLFTILSAKE